MKCLKDFLPIIIALCFSITAVSSDSANAQTVRKTVQELTEKSEMIFTGKVSDMKSEWDEQKTKIYARVTVEVDEFLKGETQHATLVITHLGGEVDEVGELYTHVPRFKKDEEVLVFVKKDKEDNLRITGGADGKLKITRSELTGKKMIGKTKTLEAFTTDIESIVKKQQEK
jgi:hypothetical protein